MFRKKKKEKELFVDDQRKVFEILLRKLKDEKGTYDVESVWVVSKLAYLLNCDDMILKASEQTE